VSISSNFLFSLLQKNGTRFSR